jgi:hypothetical protein
VIIATKADVEKHFSTHPGKIREVKLMQGFGFLEFDDEMDAKEVVPGNCHLLSYMSGP